MTAEAVERLVARGTPEVYTSSNVDGGDAAKPGTSRTGAVGDPKPRRNSICRPWRHRRVLRRPVDSRAAADLIEFLAAHEMNTFVYTPKDDPLVRRAWREAYTGDDLQQLTELVERCAALGIEFVYCLGPGLSMRYSDPGDIEALSAKLLSVGALGVRTFGLLLDDIPTDLRRRPIGPPFPTSPEHMFASSTRSQRDRSGPSIRCLARPSSGDAAMSRTALPGRADRPAHRPVLEQQAICSPTLDLDDTERFAEATTGRASDVLGRLPGEQHRDGLRAAHQTM